MSLISTIDLFLKLLLTDKEGDRSEENHFQLTSTSFPLDWTGNYLILIFKILKLLHVKNYKL